MAAQQGGYNDNIVPRGTLEVIEFDPRQEGPAVLECAPEASCLVPDLLSHVRLRYRAVTSAIVAFVVLALHALVLAPLLLHGSSGSPAPRYGAPTLIQATLIDDQSTFAIAPPALSRPDLRPIHVNLPDSPSRNADPGLAALYGRYLGQIHARIDRAWLRPRSAIGAPMFRCQVEVWQRRDGTVQTLTLQHCNGTTRWQQSLVQGIDDASPLPAPPDPAVFARRVVLHFQAVAYAPGQRAGEYERARPTLADDPKAAGPSPILSLRQAVGASHRGVIQLRITGSQIEIEPQR